MLDLAGYGFNIAILTRSLQQADMLPTIRMRRVFEIKGKANNIENYYFHPAVV